MKTEKDMIIALTNSGMTEAEIAESIGSTQPTVHRIKKGSKTNYRTGKAIERLYIYRVVKAA